MQALELQLAAVNAATATNETRPRNIPPERRTSVTTLAIEKRRSDIEIRDSITGKPIREVFAMDTPFHRQETEINLRMLDQLARAEAGSMAVWLSPPWPGNDLGKILVATTRNKLEGREIVQFDVTGPIFKEKQFQEFATWLQPFSQNGYFLLNKSPLEFLRQAIPMPAVWDGIENGNLEQRFNEVVAQMKPLVQKHSGQELRQEIYTRTGADTDKACPEMMMLTRISVNAHGEVLHPVRECPVCHFDVKKFRPEGIPSGWECPGCKGKYLGC